MFLAVLFRCGLPSSIEIFTTGHKYPERDFTGYIGSGVRQFPVLLVMVLRLAMKLIKPD